jgi:hypothetical protein
MTDGAGRCGLFIGGWFPGGAAVGGFVAKTVGRVPDGGVLRIRSVHAAKVAGDGRANYFPVIAAVGGAQERARGSSEPTNFFGRSRTADEIGGDSAKLLKPGAARVFGVKDLSAWTDTPDFFSAGSGDANVETESAYGTIVDGPIRNFGVTKSLVLYQGTGGLSLRATSSPSRRRWRRGRNGLRSCACYRGAEGSVWPRALSRSTGTGAAAVTSTCTCWLAPLEISKSLRCMASAAWA